MNSLQGILAVDGDEFFLKKIEKIIKGKYAFYSVTNVIAMYQALEIETVSMLILDYQMNSTHTGLEIAINVKKNFPFIKILLVTSFVSVELVKAAINSEAIDAFLEKPVKSVELKSLIDTNMEKSASTRYKFELALQQLKMKEELTREMIGEFGGELPLLDILYNESLRSTSLNESKCIGITVFKNNEIYLQKFLSNDLVIENEFLFSSFLKTLELLSKKFKIEGKNFQEIEFQDMILWVMRINTFTFVYYLNGNNIPQQSEADILKKHVYRVYNQILQFDYISINEHLGETILKLNDLLIHNS